MRIHVKYWLKIVRLDEIKYSKVVYKCMLIEVENNPNHCSWATSVKPHGLQTPTPNAEFTRCLYSVHAARPQRANGALEDPTALPQRAV